MSASKVSRRQFLTFLPGLALGTMAPLEQFPGPPPFYGDAEIAEPLTPESVADEVKWHRIAILFLSAIQGVTIEQLNKLSVQHIDTRWWRPKGARRI